MLGSEGGYLYHLSLSEPDSILQISFPSVTPTAAVEIASVQEFSIAVDMCYLVLDVVWACIGKGERSKLSLLMKLQ